MRLLLTGAFSYSEAQLNALRALGAELVFQKDERGAPETDFAAVEAAVCNGLFLYHDIKEFKNLKCIQLTSAGLDRVPLDYIQEKGIKLCNARGVYSVPMAEWALCGVLSLYKHLNT
ncbi:MAG: hydroxyacid dehydrogenase, partial [Candidatus Fimenecus sp.]